MIEVSVECLTLETFNNNNNYSAVKIYQQLRAKAVSLITCVTVLGAWAQTVDTVTGTVTDQTGEPLI